MELSRKLVHCPAHSERQSGQKEGRGLWRKDLDLIHISLLLHALPEIVRLAELSDGLLLDTVHWYCPSCLPVTGKVWVYCTVIESFSTVIPPETTSESLVQVTVVAGPPVEVQVRVNRGLSPLRSESTVNIIPCGMVTSPAEHCEE